MDGLSVLMLSHRRGLRPIFESDEHSLLITDVEPTPASLQRALAAGRHACILLDLGIDSGVAVELLSELREHAPDLPIVGVLCCASAATQKTVELLAALGVRSFVDLHTDQGSIVRAVMSATSGCSVVQLQGPPAALNGAAGFLGRTQAVPLRPSSREREVLELLAQGMTREQIAKVTSLSLRTVMRTITSVEEKLDAPCPFLLGMRAAKLGLVP